MSNTLDEEEIARALSLEEAALNEFKKRKSSVTSYESTKSNSRNSYASPPSSSVSLPSSSGSSIKPKKDEPDLISFVAEVPKNSADINKLDPYDKLKQSILKLGETNQQQVVPYQSPYSSQQQSYYSPQIYSSNYSMGPPRIGFENFLPQHHPQQPTYYAAYAHSPMNQQMAIQKYGFNNQITQPPIQTQYTPPPAVVQQPLPSTSSARSEKSYYSIKEPPKAINHSKISNQKSDKNDLINLDVSDEATSFANILHTFDPLISKHSINEEASRNYYTDQDPFDYIYSGNSHCSDPLYEAVSRNEKLMALRSQGEMYYECPPSTSEQQAPPPLPPRNSNAQTTYSSDVQYSKKLYENIIEKTNFDKDSMAFFNMVKELRSKYTFDDDKSNVGHIKAAIMSSSYLNVSSIKILVYPSFECFNKQSSAVLPRLNSSENYQRLENYSTPLVFTCDVKSAVNHIIMQALAMTENEIQGSPENFILKTVGSQEWLSDVDVTLCHLQYVQTSISLEKDVQFALFPRNEKYLKAIARTEIDDKRDRELRIENILPKDPVTSISYESLIILLETLEMEIDKVQAQSTNAPNTHISFNSSGVIQACRAICSLLGCIDTFELYHAINSLKETCDMQSNLQHNSRLDILSEKGNYAKVSLRPRSMCEEIKYRCDEIRDAVQHLLEVYTQAFQVNYSVNRPQWNTSYISTTTVTQNVMLNLMAIHRPMQTWKYDEYMMGIQIYHGTRFIGEPLITQCSNSLAGFFPRLTFDTWINLDVPISSLPREARIVFVLFGCMKQNPDGSMQNADNSSNNMNSSLPQEVTKVELGWTSVQFFDYDREMIQGVYFLTIWPPSADKYFCPSPQRATHPNGDYCPILSVEIPSYGGRVTFPDITPNPNVPKLDFYSLDTNLQEELIDTIDVSNLFNQIDKREVLWEKRFYLHSYPKALPKILNAAHNWDSSQLADYYGMMNNWAPLNPLTSLELLLPRFPDMFVRAQAVKWISKMTEDQLIDYLPQLTQALKFDCYDASPLSCFLLGRSLESPRVAHYLYWLLVQNLPGSSPQNSMEAQPNIEEDQILLQYRFHKRNQLILRALLAICGEKLCSQFMFQNMLCKSLDEVAKSVKQAKDSLKLPILRQNVENIHQLLSENATSLPLSPGLLCSGVAVKTCSYFNSNTLPLKINFIGPDGLTFPAIYKVGDDLQQDMLTLQIVRIIDKMWLHEGLDLKIIAFKCIPTGIKRGMIEMVTNAETLKKIQVEWGITGSFKDKPIAEWLQRMNPNQLEYERAVENFTYSCAGYSIITYLLGIGDRHNENIILTNSGNIFHIDFGKFLGDAQMFGNFKRDRTPFVLTSDMAYVINGGDKPSEKFHNFVDLCCKAFNIVRKHGDLILHMLALMVSSGIPGVTSEAVNYVRNALMPGASNPEASANFAKMIHVSLKSWFTQFNFFLHNLAQLRFGNVDESGELLSFVPKTYNVMQDGAIEEVKVFGYQKRYDLEKRYTYILEVTRQHNPDKTYLFRTYKEFCELHQKLCLLFPLVRLYSLQSGISVGRSNIKTVAERRLPEVKKFVYSLLHSSKEIINSDLVVTFFHPLLRDQQEADIHTTKMKEEKRKSNEANIGGEIKFSMHYHRDTFIVMIHHARSLPLTTTGQEPNTYVKAYLIPDRSKITKRKTKLVKKSCFPSFMETLEYRMPLQIIKLRTLQITVWSHDTLQENEFLGGVQIPLIEKNLKEESVGWHQLVYLTR